MGPSGPLPVEGLFLAASCDWMITVHLYQKGDSIVAPCQLAGPTNQVSGSHCVLLFLIPADQRMKTHKLFLWEELLGHPTQRGSNSYIRVTWRAHSRMQIPELTFIISDFISLAGAQESVLKDYIVLRCGTVNLLGLMFYSPSGGGCLGTPGRFDRFVTEAQDIKHASQPLPCSRQPGPDLFLH